jgi:hypothetical protein
MTRSHRQNDDSPINGGSRIADVIRSAKGEAAEHDDHQVESAARSGIELRGSLDGSVCHASDFCWRQLCVAAARISHGSIRRLIAM